VGEDLFEADKGLAGPGDTAAIATNKIGKPGATAKDHDTNVGYLLTFKGRPQMLKLGANFSIKPRWLAAKDQLN
jgi:hypothetical protein